MSHASRHAAKRAIRDGVRIGTENQRAREGVTFFRKDHVADAFASMEFDDALFLDPFAGPLLRDRILLADRRIVMIEYYNHLRRVEYLVAAHLAQQVRGAGSATIVKHHVVRNDVDDLTNLNRFSAGVTGDDL